MNKQQQSKKKPEVYCISGFRDTLASPVFYPVIVVAVVLGITSIFGFVQNPIKLKSIVTVIQQKVAESNVGYGTANNQQYIGVNLAHNKFQKTHNSSNIALDIFSDIDENPVSKIAVEGDFERLAFNYDVTSESFWADLDSSKLETAAEELERKEKEASTFGAPIRIENQENLPSDFNLLDDSIYAINDSSKI